MLNRPLNIALFDYRIVASNPVGSLHLRLLRGLCQEHNFTVFATEFENPCAERIRWIRVRAVTRPQVLFFVTFRLAAQLEWLFFHAREGHKFDIVQMVESNVAIGNLCHSQFCHRGYLRRYWGTESPKGWRYAFRWMDHRLRARFEPAALARAKLIVAGSKGLADLLEAEYPGTSKKIQVIHNAVDTGRLGPPVDFSRLEFRRQLGVTGDHTLFAFIALGHFERKGLPQILEGLAQLRDPRAKLLVVGGEPDLTAYYGQRTTRLGLREQVTFAGMQPDPRRYLWASDALILASSYETFPLVSLEATAAGLPLISSKVFGVEEFLSEGVNGFLIEPTADGAARGMRRYMDLSLHKRCEMAERAKASVGQFTESAFLESWRGAYRMLAGQS